MERRIYARAIHTFRYDSTERWESENPIPERGEPCIAYDGVDGNWLKIGDGSSDWRTLPYMTAPRGEKGDKGDKGDRYTLLEEDIERVAGEVLKNFTDVAREGQ